MIADGVVVAVVIGAVVLGLLLISLVVGVFAHSLATAVNLFAWAAEHGFVGVALYIILWVVATPLMVVVCISGGVIRLWAEWRGARPAEAVNPAKPPKPGSPEYLDWANRRGKWAND